MEINVIANDIVYEVTEDNSFLIGFADDKNEPNEYVIVERALEFDDYDDYNEENLVDEIKIKSQIDNDEFDDQQYIFIVDSSVIATALGQLVDEGLIEADYKYFVQVAINRLRIWANLHESWNHKNEFVRRLNVIERVLEKA